MLIQYVVTNFKCGYLKNICLRAQVTDSPVCPSADDVNKWNTHMSDKDLDLGPNNDHRMIHDTPVLKIYKIQNKMNP